MSRTAGQLSPLYRRLPHGPNGMQREEVARNQRARLYGAMIESISQRGYEATSVAHVIALAGVSRRAFYEQFSNKEQCFLASYDIVLARARSRAIAAWRREHGWANRLHASCKVLFDDVAESPKGPRLALVDVLAVGPRGRERMQLADAAFERLLAAALQAAPDGIEFPALTARAVVGGVHNILLRRVLEHREHELYTLSDEVLDWIESYRAPGAARLSALGAADRPDLRPAAAVFPARGEERSRAIGSLVELTLNEGYARLSDPQIADFAGVSIEAFHAHFAGKEDCLLAILDEFQRQALAAVTVALHGAPTWPQAVHRAMSALAAYLDSHRALARVALIEVYEVGPAAIGRMSNSTEACTELLEQGAPGPCRGPLVAREAITGAIWAIVSGYVASDRQSRPPWLADQLAFTVLAPYLGSRGALQGINRARRSPRAV